MATCSYLQSTMATLVVYFGYLQSTTTTTMPIPIAFLKDSVLPSLLYIAILYYTYLFFIVTGCVQLSLHYLLSLPRYYLLSLPIAVYLVCSWSIHDYAVCYA